jgi:hypothetical protein
MKTNFTPSCNGQVKVEIPPKHGQYLRELGMSLEKQFSFLSFPSLSPKSQTVNPLNINPCLNARLRESGFSWEAQPRNRERPLSFQQMWEP